MPIRSMRSGWTSRRRRCYNDYTEEFAGRGSADKSRQIADVLTASGADAVILSAPDSIAWFLNIRGSDVANTPWRSLTRLFTGPRSRLTWLTVEKFLLRHGKIDAVTVLIKAEFLAGLAALGKADSSRHTATIPEPCAFSFRKRELSCSDPCTLPSEKEPSRD